MTQKHLRRVYLAVLLVVALLTLAACGRDEDQGATGAEPGAASVVTEAGAAEAPAEAAPTEEATEEVTEAAAPTEEITEEATEAAAEAPTEEMTEEATEGAAEEATEAAAGATEATTATEEAGATEAVTATEEAGAAAAETPEAGATEAMTATEAAEAAATVTATVQAAATEATPEAGATEAMTATEEAGATEAMTATEEAGAAEAETPEAGATEAMTATEETGATEEMTATEEAGAATETPEAGAAEAMTGTEQAGAAAAGAAALGIREAQGRTVSVSDLLGLNLTNQNGEDIGEIEDIVINLANGRVLFLTLGYGGLLDLGEKVFPIPLGALRFTPAEDGGNDFNLTLDVQEETLQDAPGFDANWPDPRDPNFDRDVQSFWSSLDEPVIARGQRGMGVRAVAGAVTKASSLLGRNVQNYEGEDIGSVVDMLVDLGSGEVRYVVLSFGGFLGIGDNLYAVPLRAFSVDPRGLYGEGGNANLLADINEQTLEQAPSFAADEYPDMTGEGWDADIEQFWNGLLGMGAARAATAAGAVQMGSEAEPSSTQVVTGTDEMTGTQEMTGTAGMTDTTAMAAEGTATEEGAEAGTAAEGTPSPEATVAGAEEMTGTTEAGAAAEGTPTAEPAEEGGEAAAGAAAGAATAMTPEATLAAAEAISETAELTAATDITGAAAITGAQAMTGTQGITGTVEAGIAGAQGQAMLASDLLGMTVVNANGDGIGEIEEMIVSLTEGRISFLTMGYGGLLDLGESIFPIPLNALRYDQENNNLVFNVDETTLENAPAFDSNWPDLTDPNYDRDLNAFWSQLDLPAVERAANVGGVRSIGGTLIRASRMIGANVTNPQGEDLGEIQDLIVDLGNGDVRYAILSFGGFLGLGEKWFAFPLDEFTASGEALYGDLNAVEDLLGVGPQLTLDVQEEDLQNAPGFDAGSLPDLSDPNWENELHQFWNPDTVTGGDSALPTPAGGQAGDAEATPEAGQAEGDAAATEAATEAATPEGGAGGAAEATPEATPEGTGGG